jgi:ABC-type nitrate/sulfonate/bicarbonate transport system ATPase subunit
MAAEGIRVEGLRHRYGDVAVLDGIDLAVAPGERIAVVGRSGCGKSTLLSLLAGLEPPTAGTIAGAGPGRCALMPQRDLLLPWRSAIDNACLALDLAGTSRGDARRQALPLFEEFDLAGFADTRPSELSGGMRQRIAFLRTLLAGREVLLLDEPFASLDAITREELQDWLAAALDREPRTTVLVTHDVDEALRVCARVVVLSPRPGRVVLDMPAASLDRARILEALRG